MHLFNNQNQKKEEPKQQKIQDGLLPVSHEIDFPELNAHNRTVTAMAFDKHTGTQMLTGDSGDYTVKLWDLNSMNSMMRSLKTFRPFDGHPVRALCFSPDKDAKNYLCCSTSSQARLF